MEKKSLAHNLPASAYTHYNHMITQWARRYHHIAGSSVKSYMNWADHRAVVLLAHLQGLIRREEAVLTTTE